MTYLKPTRALLLFLSLGLAFPAIFTANAQATTPLNVGDKVIVLAATLPVYAQAGAEDPVLDELCPGLVTYMLARRLDGRGNTWIYLGKDVQGWVQETINGSSSVTLFLDARLQQVIDDATKVIAGDPKNVDAYLARAAALKSQRQYTQSFADLDQAIKLSPADGKLYEYRAQLDWVTNHYPQGLADAKKAIELKWELPSVLNTLGSAYSGMEMFEDARRTFTEAIDRYPGYAQFYVNLGLNQDSYTSDEALADYNAAIQHDPYLAYAYALRASYYCDVCNPRDTVLQYFDQALTVDKFCASCYHLRAYFYYDLGEYDSAIKDETLAIALNPDWPGFYVTRANAYEAQGHMDLAQADLEHALQVDPDDSYSLVAYGTFNAHASQYDKALESYTHVVTMGGRRLPRARLFRAQIYIVLETYPEAIKDLDAAIPGFDQVNQNQLFGSAHLIDGAANLYKRQFKAALAHYQAVWQNANTLDFGKAYYEIGGPYRVVPQREALIDVVQTRIKNKTASNTMIYQLATIYMEFGHWQEAADTYAQYYALVKQPIPSDLQSILDLVTG